MPRERPPALVVGLGSGWTATVAVPEDMPVPQLRGWKGVERGHLERQKRRTGRDAEPDLSRLEAAPDT